MRSCIVSQMDLISFSCAPCFYSNSIVSRRVGIEENPTAADVHNTAAGGLGGALWFVRHYFFVN